MSYVTDAMREYVKKQNKNKACDYSIGSIDVDFYLRNKDKYVLARIKPNAEMLNPVEFEYKIKGLPLYLFDKDKLQRWKQYAAKDDKYVKQMLSEMEIVTDYDFSEKEIENSKRQPFNVVYPNATQSISKNKIEYQEYRAKHKELIEMLKSINNDFSKVRKLCKELDNMFDDYDYEYSPDYMFDNLTEYVSEYWGDISRMIESMQPFSYREFLDYKE